MHICKNDGKGNTQMCKLLQPKSIDKVFSKPPLMCVYIYIYIYLSKWISKAASEMHEGKIWYCGR
jgi:hypothetical protein